MVTLEHHFPGDNKRTEALRDENASWCQGPVHGSSTFQVPDAENLVPV